MKFSRTKIYLKLNSNINNREKFPPLCCILRIYWLYLSTLESLLISFFLGRRRISPYCCARPDVYYEAQLWHIITTPVSQEHYGHLVLVFDAEGFLLLLFQIIPESLMIKNYHHFKAFICTSFSYWISVCIFKSCSLISRFCSMFPSLWRHYSPLILQTLTPLFFYVSQNF